MNILILGGTGAMGSHLSKLLVQRGENVYVTSRSNTGIKDGIQFIRGNAHDFSFLKSIQSKKWDAIIDFMVYDVSEFESRYLDLLDFCNHYIFVSSARVYADVSKPILENSPRLKDTIVDEQFLLSGEYAISKAKEEDLLFSANNKNYTIVRPYITYSQYRLQLGVYEKESWLFRALSGRTIILPKKLYDRKTTLTYGKDVSSIIAALIGKSNTFGEAFHITTAESLTWGEVMDIYATSIKRVKGFKPKFEFIDEDICEKTFQYRYDRLFNREFDNSKVLEVVPNYEFIKTEEGLYSCIKSFVENPKFLYIAPGIEAIHDRKKGEYTPLKTFLSFNDKIKYIIRRNII